MVFRLKKRRCFSLEFIGTVTLPRKDTVLVLFWKTTQVVLPSAKHTLNEHKNALNWLPNVAELCTIVFTFWIDKQNTNSPLFGARVEEMDWWMDWWRWNSHSGWTKYPVRLGPMKMPRMWISGAKWFLLFFCCEPKILPEFRNIFPHNVSPKRRKEKHR